MHTEIEQQIEGFVSFLSCIQEMPPLAFNMELHARLNAIVRSTQNYPQQRESFRQMLLDQGQEHLTKGYLQEHTRAKPYGYAGDFHVIDWIYKQVSTTALDDSFWDDFYQSQTACQAVRNRKRHLIKLVLDRLDEVGQPIKILDLASGPCRDVREAIEAAGDQVYGSLVHCVDIEPRAIEYAQKVTRPYAKLVNFNWECANVFRFRSNERYDIVWSAGLFDYLNDKLATALIARMWNHTADGGRMVIGNFHPSNPTRNYMEWCMDWVLIHRTEEELHALGLAAGIPADRITIDREPLGVCIFLEGRK